MTAYANDTPERSYILGKALGLTAKMRVWLARNKCSNLLWTFENDEKRFYNACS